MFCTRLIKMDVRTSTARKSPGRRPNKTNRREMAHEFSFVHFQDHEDCEKDKPSPRDHSRISNISTVYECKQRADLDNSQEKQSEKLPSLRDIMSQLRPSRELLEYYRQKIDEYDEIHNEMIKQLGQFKSVFEEQHVLRCEVAGKEQKILDLQKALSDMQIAVYREKEAALRLQAENDKLKIQEVADRKKIQQLLSLGEPSTLDGEVTYFLKEPPSKPIVRRFEGLSLDSKAAAAQQQKGKQQMSSAAKKRGKNIAGANASAISAMNIADAESEVVQLQIEALEAELEEQERLYKERLSCVTEECELRQKELELRHERDAERIQQLADKLKKTQELLYDSTQAYLELQSKQRKDERRFMAEREQLAAELERAKVTADSAAISSSVPDVGQQSVLADMTAGIDLAESILRQNRKKHSHEIEALQNELRQAQEMADVYREQVVALEDDNGRLREQLEMEKQLFKDHESKLLRRVEMVQSRYRDLERRRNLEVEGFNNDVRQLRNRLKAMEQQLYQLTLGLSEESDSFPLGLGAGTQRTGDDATDVRILRAIRKTSTNSKKMLGDLRGLKTKVYQMEDRVRKL